MGREKKDKEDGGGGEVEDKAYEESKKGRKRLENVGIPHRMEREDQRLRLNNRNKGKRQEIM
jgi:hypothetical protein